MGSLLRRSRGGTGVAAAVAALLAGCAGVRPAAGEAPWHELRTEHFVLRTEVARERARQLALDCELDWALLVEAMPSLAAARGPIELYALSSQQEYLAVTGQRADWAGYTTVDEMGRQRIVVYVSPTSPAWQPRLAVAHELAHVMSRQVIPVQPRWFAEGLALHLQTVAVPGRDGKRWIGAVGPRLDPIAARDLLGWVNEAEGRETRYYETAGLLVRYLASALPDGYADLQRRLAAGEDAGDAWNAAFPAWSLAAPGGTAALDRVLRTSARTEAAPRAVSAQVAVEPSDRPMTAADEWTTRLMLRTSWSPARREAAIAAAMAVDPGHVVAQWLRAEGTEDPAIRAASARAAMAAHPEDPFSWVLRATVLPPHRSAAREANLRRAVTLGAEAPELLFAVAMEIQRAQPDEALGLLTRARDRAPWAAAFRAGRARALARLGRCDEAAGEARIGRALAPAQPSTLPASVQAYCGPPAARVQALLADATAALDEGRPAAALRWSDAALANDAASPLAWNERGRALDRLGRPAEAERAYRKAVELAPTSGYAWRNLGLALERQGKGAEAVDACRRQTEVAPAGSLGWRELGMVLERAHRPAEAVAPLARALELAPKDALAIRALGRVRAALKDGKGALEALERALALRGGPTAANDAAYALADAGVELARAAAWADEAIAGHAAQLAAAREGRSLEDEAELSGQIVSAWDTVGWLRFRQGQLADAGRWLAAAERLAPGAVLSEHVCEVREREGRTADAADACARAAASASASSSPAAMATASAARARLQRLLGEVPAADAVVRARAQLAGWRTLPAATPVRAEPGARLELLVAADGTVEAVRDAGGTPLPEATAALRAARLEVAFPDPAVPSLVLRAAWRCEGDRCAAVIE